MFPERKKEIIATAKKRLDKLLKKRSWEDITFHGSFIRFCMSINTHDWLTEKEFDSSLVDDVLRGVFHEYEDRISPSYLIKEPKKELELTPQLKLSNILISHFWDNIEILESYQTSEAHLQCVDGVYDLILRNADIVAEVIHSESTKLQKASQKLLEE